ncbi:MAG: hypothetical protein IME96_04045 [Proteobacteria bacterium]|nr:hypothetical protein [Pseudomonadota bacterium]
MRISIIYKLLITLLTFPILSGCLTLSERPEASYYGARKHNARLGAASFQDEIRELEEKTGDKANLSVHSKSYLQLALLHLDHRNPSRDYSKALECLEKYAAVEPRAADLDEVQDWITALKEIERLQGEQDTTKKTPNSRIKEKRLKSENKKLNDEINSLKATVEKLMGDIEKLNALDLELEKKRRINR